MYIYTYIHRFVVEVCFNSIYVFIYILELYSVHYLTNNFIRIYIYIYLRMYIHSQDGSQFQAFFFD